MVRRRAAADCRFWSVDASCAARGRSQADRDDSKAPGCAGTEDAGRSPPRPHRESPDQTGRKQPAKPYPGAGKGGGPAAEMREKFFTTKAQRHKEISPLCLRVFV